jgi:hypothetical protein
MGHRVTVLAAALLIGGAAVMAQQSDESSPVYAPGPYKNLKMQQVVRNFEANLRSPIPGVVEATIGHTIWLRLVRPDANLYHLQEAITEVAANGTTAAIRYRASLAAMVLYSPGLFCCLTDRSYKSADDLFAGVSGRAQETLIGQNR